MKTLLFTLMACFISTTVFAGPVTAVGCLKGYKKMCNKTGTGIGVHAGAPKVLIHHK